MGKSSLLEALANDQIKLPRGATGKPVTRTPIKLQLRKAAPSQKSECYFQVITNCYEHPKQVIALLQILLHVAHIPSFEATKCQQQRLANISKQTG